MYLRVKNALNELNLPLYLCTKGEDSVKNYIVLNYTSTPILYSDNTNKFTRYQILLNLILTKNIDNTTKELLKLMRANGFKGGRCQTIQPEYNGSVVVGYNTAITFTIDIEEDMQ